MKIFTVIYSPLLAYPLRIVGIIPQNTHFHTFRQVYEQTMGV